MRAFILQCCTLAGLAATVAAADLVTVEATKPTANEASLEPGVVTFTRSDDSKPLTVYYRIAGTTSGSARAARHGGYVREAIVGPSGSDYRRARIPDIAVPGGVAELGLDFFGRAKVQADGVGGTIATYTVTNGGRGYDIASPPLVTVAYDDPKSWVDQFGGGATAEAVVKGAVDTITISNGGSGYTSAPTVVFTGGGGGSGAAATAAVVVGISEITVTDGGVGYTAAPSVSFSGGGGTGAAATATVTSGVVSAITITVPGTGYTSAPTVTLAGGGASTQAAAVATIGGSVQSVTVTNAGTNYTAVPTISFTGGGGGSGATGAVEMYYYVSQVKKVLVGTGYVSEPKVTIAKPAVGIQATAVPVITGNALDSTLVTHPGYGYIIPDVAAVGVTTGGLLTDSAVLRPVLNGVTLYRLAVENGGNGYAMPTLTVGGGGSGAIATVLVQDGVIIEVNLVDGGIDYPPSTTQSVTVTSPQGGSGADIRATINAQGKVSALNLMGGGTGYPMPVITLSGAGQTTFGGTPFPSASVTLETVVDSSGVVEGAGRVVSVTVPRTDMGYGGISSGILNNITDPRYIAGFPPYDLFLGSGAASTLVIVGPDFMTPASVSLDPITGTPTARIDTSTGELVGTVQFAVGEKTKELPIVPMRNGVGGARTVRVVVDPPLVAGRYTTNAQNAAVVTIADADDAASIKAVIATAYPIPPVTTWELPLEVQGRAEFRVDFTGDNDFRNLTYTIGGSAVRGTDYLLVEGYKTIAQTAASYTVATSTTSGPVIPVTDRDCVDGTRIDVDDVVCIENPNDVTNGIYIVRAVTETSITLDTAIRKTFSSTPNTMRIRRLGKKVIDGTDIREYGSFGPLLPLYYFAFPLNQTGAPRGRKTISMTFTQTDDYQVMSPNSAEVILADTSVIASVAWVANAGQPNTNGAFEVRLSAPFGKDIEVPFTIKSTSSATYYDGTNANGDYSIANIDATLTPKRGTVRIPAGTMTKQVEVVPRTSTPVSSTPETVDIVLSDSPDYRLAPTGDAAMNSSVSLSIAPLYQTTLNEPVFLSATKIQDGAEGSITTNGILRVYLSNSEGVPLTGVLTQDLSFVYDVSGLATSNTDYQALSGAGVISTNSNHVDITVWVNDDLYVEGDEDVRIQIQPAPGYQVSSVAQATALIVDDEPMMSVSAVSDAYESGTPGSFTITSSHAVNRSVTVRYAISGSATSAGMSPDYSSTDLPGTVVMPPNQQSVVLSLPVVKDSLYEKDPEETITLTIISDNKVPATYGVDTVKSQTMTIHDCPVIKITKGADAVEGVSNGYFVVTNVNDKPSPVDTTVLLSVSGTATPDSSSTAKDFDYRPLPTSVVIPAGQSSATMSVVANFDNASDPGETVIVQIQPDALVPASYTTSGNPALNAPSAVTIVIGEPAAPILSIAATGNAVEGSATGSFTVTNQAMTAWPATLTVAYTVLPSPDTTAGSGDYISLSGSVDLPAGATSVSIPVTATADHEIESNETLAVALSISPAYSLGSASQASLTIIDASLPILTITKSIDPVEGSTQGAVVITNLRAPAHDKDIQVHYIIDAAVSGAATLGTDYTTESGTLSGMVTILAGQSSATVKVTALTDAIWGESGEIIKINLVSYDSAWGGEAYDLGSPNSAILTIVDTTVNPNTDPPIPPVVAPVTPASDKGGCGVGSGLGLILAGLGMAGAVALRRRRRDAA